MLSISMLRKEKKFASVEELKETVLADREKAQKFFEKNIFLGLGIKMLLAIILALVIRKWKPNLFKILNIAFIVIVVWNILLNLIL